MRRKTFEQARVMRSAAAARYCSGLQEALRWRKADGCEEVSFAGRTAVWQPYESAYQLPNGTYKLVTARQRCASNPFFKV